MWLVSLRDLQFRRRRFAVAVFAAAVVFALALLMSGISASFSNEVHRTVSAFGADAWIVPRGEQSPFTAPKPFAADVAGRVAGGGVTAASAVAIVRGTVDVGGLKDVNVIGVVPGAVGSPTPDSGRAISASGEAVVDDRLGLPLDGAFRMSGSVFTVVGLAHGVSYFAGQSAIFVSLSDAQDVAFAGQPLATAVVTRGVPAAAPTGYSVLTNRDVERDLVRPVAQANQTIALMKALLWAVAAGIIGSIVYLSAQERTRDFAVLKASGASTRALLAGLLVQSIVLSAAAVVLSVVLAIALAPTFAMAVEIPSSAYLLLPLLALVIGGLASLAGLRRAVRVDPALAFTSA